MTICIAGMHRSGTSMITRLLNLCGLYLGPKTELSPAALSRRDKLGASCGVKVPVGEGRATHPYRVLRLRRSRRKATNKTDEA